MIEPAPDRWNPATRVAFRFFCLYFFVYVLSTQMLSSLVLLPVGRVPDIGAWLSGLVEWVGLHLLHVTTKPVPSGSGDTLFDWVQTFTLLLLAVPGTAVWSALDRRRQAYPRLNRWVRVFVRFALGSTMLTYGFAKAVPLQMPAPQLTRMLEPYGNFSLMGVLWYSIGASFPYERFVGLAELAGGTLLFIPRAATLGALVCLADTIEIFTLNMTYDVPVKLFSLHLILMSLFLLAPDIKRLAATVFAVGARRRWAAVAQVALGLYLLGMGWYGAHQSWYSLGGGAPRPPLYGIWTIDRMTIDGVERAPLVTDLDRWRRVVVQSSSTIAFWQMNDTPLYYQAKYDDASSTFTLKQGASDAGSLRASRQTADRIVFDGTVSGHDLHFETTRLDHTKFQLVSRGFSWIQESPYNR